MAERSKKVVEPERMLGAGGGGEKVLEQRVGKGQSGKALVSPPEGGGSERNEREPPGGGDTSAAPQPAVSGRPDPEIIPPPTGRRFSARYKQDLLRLVDGCTQPGEIGALLRREGLHSSHLTTWRRQREEGSLSGLAPKKRGRKPDPDRELRLQITQLEAENRRLNTRLEKAELILEVQKKVARLLGIEEPTPQARGKS